MSIEILFSQFYLSHQKNLTPVIWVIKVFFIRPISHFKINHEQISIFLFQLHNKTTNISHEAKKNGIEGNFFNFHNGFLVIIRSVEGQFGI